MVKKKSEYKKIFEDDSLSDQQKYTKINNIQHNSSNFWTFLIGLNLIIWPLVIFTPNIEIDHTNSNLVFSKDLKR